LELELKLKSKHLEYYNNNYANIHESFSRMDPMASNLTLTTNYDNHTITLYDVKFSSGNMIKCTIDGPSYKFNIELQMIKLFLSVDDKRYKLDGCLDEKFDAWNQSILIVICGESNGMDEWNARIRMPYDSRRGPITISNMDTCIFSEVMMPMKGVHDG